MSIIKWTMQWAVKQNISFAYIKKTSTIQDLTSANPLFVFCKEQTKGRGTKSNKWINSDFMGVWIFQKKRIKSSFSVMVGETLLKSFQTAWPKLPFRFKKPNDIYLYGKKISGVLIETVYFQGQYQITLGIGINVLKSPKKLITAGCIGSKTKKSQWWLFLSTFNSLMGF